MNYRTSKYFDREFEKFAPSVQKAFRKQAAFLLEDIRHPSLRAKKFNETEDVWQARVNDNVRFYFRIEFDHYLFLNIRKHPK